MTLNFRISLLGICFVAMELEDRDRILVLEEGARLARRARDRFPHVIVLQSFDQDGQNELPVARLF